MESIGEKLRNRRTEEGYSINQVSRDTNIAKSYLEALESEDFLVFPGEPYLIGFLRNYSEYLGLDVDEMISLYKNFKIQEQPVPMDELIIRRGLSPLLIVFIGILIAAALGSAGFLLYPRIMSPRPEKAQAVAVEKEEPAAVVQEPNADAFSFSDEIAEQRFSAGTVVEFSNAGSFHRFSLNTADDAVLLSTSVGEIALKLGEERDVDLDGDGSQDIKILVRDIDSSAGTAVLRLDKSIYEPQGPRVEAANLPVGSTQVASRTMEPRVLYTAASPEVITMSIGSGATPFFAMPWIMIPGKSGSSERGGPALKLFQHPKDLGFQRRCRSGPS